MENGEKIINLNKTRVSSSREAIAVLEELREIGGKIIKGSILEGSIKNYLGVRNTDDFSELINDLREIETKSTDEFDTSAVPIEKIKELEKEYQEYIEKGLSDREALDKIYKDNKGKISSKEIENFVQKQRDNYQEKIRKNVDEKATKIADRLIEKNEDLKEKGEVKEIIKKVILENKKTVSEDLGKNSSIKEIDLEIKDFIKNNKKIINDIKVDELGKNIREEIYKENSNLSEQQKSEIEDYINFTKKIYQTPERIDRNIGEAIIYAQDQGLSEGQVKVGTEKTESFIKIIENPEPISNLIGEYKSIVDKINWKLPIKIKECDHLDELLKKTIKSEKLEKLIDSTQKIVNWKENLLFSVAQKIGLDKFFINVSGKILGEEFVKNSLVILSQKSLEEGSFIILQSFIGGGAPALAVTAATVTFEAATIAATTAETALIIASSTAEMAIADAALAVGTATEAVTAAAAKLAIANAVTAGETSTIAGAALAKATTTLATTTAAAGSSATSIGTAAATGLVPGVGWVIAAVMAVSTILKPVFDKVKNFLSSVGLNFTKGIKNFLEENLGLVGKFGSFVINLAEDVMIMAGAALGASMIVPILIVVLVVGGIFGNNQFGIGPMAASLVPPKGELAYENIIDNEDNDYSNMEYSDNPLVYCSYDFDGLKMYVFEEKSTGGRMKDRYDLMDIDGGIWLGSVGSYALGSNDKLDKRVIPAYTAMVEAGKVSGQLSRSGDLFLISGYRSVAEQWRLWNEALAKYGSVAEAQKWASNPNTGLSSHASGRAIDIRVCGGSVACGGIENQKLSATFKWLEINAWKYGFYNYYREPWHWEYNPSGAMCGLGL